MRALDARIRRAVGSDPVRYEPRAGGYSTADRYAVELADGRRIFVKSAAEPNLADWLRREHEVYTALEGDFLPQLIGWDDDGERPLLALEDLSGADWTTRWEPARVAAVLEALREIAAAVPPPNTGPVRETFPQLWGRWREVEASPQAFLSLGLRDAAWLERSLPTIIAAADAAQVDGDRICHLDVRSDNMCFRSGRAVLVDWNWVSLGNPEIDVAVWLPSLRVEGGPPPWDVLPGAAPLAAFGAGIWAAVAGLPPPETAPTVRVVQRQQLSVALDWIDRELL